MASPVTVHEVDLTTGSALNHTELRKQDVHEMVNHVMGPGEPGPDTFSNTGKSSCSSERSVKVHHSNVRRISQCSQEGLAGYSPSGFDTEPQVPAHRQRASEPSPEPSDRQSFSPIGDVDDFFDSAHSLATDLARGDSVMQIARQVAADAAAAQDKLAKAQQIALAAPTAEASPQKDLQNRLTPSSRPIKLPKRRPPQIRSVADSPSPSLHSPRPPQSSPSSASPRPAFVREANLFRQAEGATESTILPEHKQSVDDFLDDLFSPKPLSDPAAPHPRRPIGNIQPNDQGSPRNRALDSAESKPRFLQDFTKDMRGDRGRVIRSDERQRIMDGVERMVNRAERLMLAAPAGAKDREGVILPLPLSARPPGWQNVASPGPIHDRTPIGAVRSRGDDDRLPPVGNANTRQVISVRDGIGEILGSALERGLSPLPDSLSDLEAQQELEFLARPASPALTELPTVTTPPAAPRHRSKPLYLVMQQRFAEQEKMNYEVKKAEIRADNELTIAACGYQPQVKRKVKPRLVSKPNAAAKQRNSKVAKVGKAKVKGKVKSKAAKKVMQVSDAALPFELEQRTQGPGPVLQLPGP
eukprot:gnl/MRDRNA2_/MRDRNA2_130636_c0_seq1.p1 gnl/MRDRNA2_/MRDRNA2_130636_c0~~gnl/MRDRNA2_/MRDRNA2_130636_c0_seq1.p1  ORF type:complete len:585 (+),score=93.32 gnl/MRDRNA2_/MRDRNA2_130636_c0_seq1:50-1804(+)